MDYMGNFPQGYPINPQESALYQQRQQQMFQQQRQMQQPQQYFYAPPAQTGARIWVDGREEVDKYPVGPNQAVDLWDRTAPPDSPRMYTKAADASGRTIVTLWRLFNEQDVLQQPQQNERQEYAKKTELDVISQTVRTLGDSIQTLHDELDDMSKALYGVAGAKKKSGKKDADE